MCVCVWGGGHLCVCERGTACKPCHVCASGKLLAVNVTKAGGKKSRTEYDKKASSIKTKFVCYHSACLSHPKGCRYCHPRCVPRHEEMVAAGL